MEILMHRYGSICEPDIIQAFQANNITVVEDTLEITQKNISSEERIRSLAEAILVHQKSGSPFAFVFTVNFFPYISDICEKLHTLYFALSVDCPVAELFSNSIRNSCNRIFLFDQTQYTFFHDANPDGVFYLPLATNVDRWNNVISASDSVGQSKAYCHDITFIGSLYREKSPLDAICLSDSVDDNNGSKTDINIANQILSAYDHGFIRALLEAQSKVFGYNFLYDSLPDVIAQHIKTAAGNSFPQIPDAFTDPDKYFCADHYLAAALAVKEREETLARLSSLFDTHLYTASNTEILSAKAPKLHIHPPAATLTEMPLLFNHSKINLNITLRSIQSGLSQRIWDVLGCSGFLLSNYQAEIPEYFIPGEDLVLYESQTDLLEKCAYYLKHEDERQAIAANGYEKVKAMHTYQIRIAQLLQILSQ
ncbi:MAG: glycosyltransferase [Lachnospiraceae bacterium]|nr:glycosyltransferase [Lachnospiraceae bacterium]